MMKDIISAIFTSGYSSINNSRKDATPEDLKTTYDMLMALKKKERDNNEF